jgi:predicted acyl esterase
MGPWRHSGVNYEGFSLGPLMWDGDTALQFRRDVLQAVFQSVLARRRAESRYAAGIHLQHR